MQLRFIAPLAAIAMIAGAPAFAKPAAAGTTTEKPVKAKHMKKAKTTKTTATTTEAK